MAKLTGVRRRSWQKRAQENESRAQEAEARAREHETMYEAERKTVAEQRDRLQALEREVEANANVRANLDRQLKAATLQKERHESLLSHVKIALRACQRSKGRKKKGPSLRQAQAILEAAVDEDGHYAAMELPETWWAAPWWAVGAGALAYMFLKGAVKT